MKINRVTRRFRMRGADSERAQNRHIFVENAGVSGMRVRDSSATGVSESLGGAAVRFSGNDTLVEDAIFDGNTYEAHSDVSPSAAINTNIPENFASVRFENETMSGFADDYGSDILSAAIIDAEAQETANAEEPQGDYPRGTRVDFTDSGDGSGTGYYILDQSETWRQLE